MTGGNPARINFEEAHELAMRLSGKMPHTAENAYVDIVLTAVLPMVQSRFDFVLKGGTAIVKTHLHPYRFSYDLDFSYFSKGASRKHYRAYQNDLEKLATDVGFHISGAETDKHRESGRIFILKLVDEPEYFRMPVKLSVSSIDETPCFGPEIKKFKPIFEISKEPYGLLYPDLFGRLNSASAKVLSVEELCAEKIRALATRGSNGEWSLILRDAVDLHVMDVARILKKVLSENAGVSCIRKKFLSIRGTSYWAKFNSFMASKAEIKIGKEDAATFIDKSMLDEMAISETVENVRTALRRILQA